MTKTTETRPRDGERGVALIITMFLLAALSALAVSMMFLSQTETYSTLNYTMMTQARYAGEAGVHKTVNFLMNSYTLPTTAEVTSTYNATVSPVTYNGNPVILSAKSGVSSNYPTSSIATAFASAGTGTLVSSDAPVSYQAYATLMSMQVAGSTVVQTWRIVSDGIVSGTRSASVEVTSTLETPVIGVSGNGYAAFATGSGCGAITLSGSASTNSYDSNAALVSGTPVLATTAPQNGNIGTNGNLTFSGGATVKGKLYTPRRGVGTCNNGAGGIAGDAETQSGSATLTEGLVQLPSVWTPPTPAAPSPLPGTATNTMDRNHPCKDNAGNTMSRCTSAGDYTAIATFTGGASVATATTMGNLTITSDYTMHLAAGYYTFNTLNISGAAKIVVDSGPVIINIAGVGLTGSTKAFDLSGGGVANSTYKASNLQILYGGTQPVQASGGTAMSAVINSPNAAFTLSGGANFYGAVIASTITDSGGTNIYYDRQLNSMFSSQGPGNPLLTSFSWKKY